MRLITTLSAALLMTMAQLAHAVENRDALPLWTEGEDLGFGIIEQLNSLDVYPNVTGIEAIGFNESITAVGAGAGLARMQWRQRIQFRNAASGALIEQFTLQTRSFAYPTDDNTFDYVCNDQFVFDLEADNSIDDCDANIYAGIAETAAGGRYLVVGVSAIIDYFDGFSSDGAADVYKIHVYDLATGNLAWARSFPLEQSAGSGDPWELDAGLSGVADYLAEDGTDEVRIAQGRELVGGSWRSRYMYYNLATGASIDTVSFSTSQP